MAGGGGTVWFQREIAFAAKKRGFHVITDEIANIPDLTKIKVGLCHVLLKHTSASLGLNEKKKLNNQITLRKKTDMEMVLNTLVPPNMPFTHTLEGPDDMPAHAKTAMLGCNITIPITDGKLNMGTYQGIWLCEHRDHASERKLVVTMQGMPK